MKPFERIADADVRTHRFFVTVIAIVAGVALMLATAGIYALMSFTLARRTREIGIRTALGAAPFRVVTATFSRAFRQVALGVLIGSVPGGVLLALVTAETGNTSSLVAWGTLTSAAFVLVVALLACVVPARRALHIQPTEALRAEA